MLSRSLQRTLTLHSVLAVFLPFVIILLLGFLWGIPQIRKDAEERQLLLAQAIGMQVESYLETGAVIIRAASSVPFDHNLPGHNFEQHLDALLGTVDSMSSLYAVTADGKVPFVALRKSEQQQHDDLIRINLSHNPLLKKILNENKPFWSDTFLSVINGGLTVAYGVPARGGALIGEVDLSRLTRFLTRLTNSSNIIILIVDHKGQIIADNGGRYTAQQLNISNIPLVRRGLVSETPVVGQMNFFGTSMSGSIAPVPAIDWHIIVAKSDALLFETYRNMLSILVAGILFAVFSSVAVSVFQAARLARHFSQLAGYAEEVALGKESSIWPTSAIIEFNRLSTALQLMARRLQESELLYRTLFDQLPDGVVLWDAANLSPLQFNTAAHAQLGYTRTEFSALTVADFEAEHDRSSIHNTTIRLRQEGAVSFESTHRTKSGDIRVMQISLRLIELAEQQMILALHHDITARKQAEEERLSMEQQLLHTQKLESLGVLAGGIAHDFNNILMAIIGNADLALMNLNKESPAVDNLKSIEQAAARAADLAKQMLAYSGKGRFVVENIDLNILLDEMLHMLEVSISKKAVLRFNPYHPLPTVNADATQMRQIVMNLVINASEAIGDKSGVIAITTGCMDCDRSYLKDVWLDENLTDGLYVYLEVADSGCGMDKETMAKLFDPFFTTKFTGRGLGMAAVLGIVRGHKGAIKVYSEPGKGTTFKILLPASNAPVELFNHSVSHNDWRGSGTVLLVDDEESVRGIGTEMLKVLGFSVVTAVDGRDAVEIFKNNNDFAFVLLDLTMPHMDGEQCFRELKRMKPEVKVLMSSGYNEQEVTQKFVGKGLTGFVQKPYKLSTLRDVIQAIGFT